MLTRNDSYNSPKKLVYLQYGRAVAALMVVAFHAAGLVADKSYWGFSSFGNWYVPLGNAGVYFFFVLSGFIILHAHRTDIGNPKALKRYLSNRTIRVYPFYWCVAITIMIVGILIPSLADGRDYSDFWFVARTLTLLPLGGADGNLAVTWTLYFEIAFYLIFTAFIFSRITGFITIVLWATSSTTATVLGIENVFFSHLTWLFIFGMVASSTFHRGDRFGRSTLLFGILLFAVALALVALVPQLHASAQVQNSLVLGIASALIVYGLAVAERRNSNVHVKLFSVLGDASFSIYLVHYPAISLLAKLLLKLNFPAWLATPTLIILGTIVGLMAHILLEKPITLRLRRLATKAHTRDRAPAV